MSDTTLNRFVAQFPDAATRIAFVPSPPTPGSGPDPGYFAYQQDDGSFWAWDLALSDWVQTGGGGGGSVTIYHEITTLSDADIKALPTTPIDIVPAQGAGTIVVPLAIVLMFKAAATAYTNIHAEAWMKTALGTTTSSLLGNDPTLGVPTTDLSDLLNSTGDKAVFFNFPFMDDRGSANNWGIMTYIETLSVITNVPLAMEIENNGAGALTGGNAGNEIVVDVTYRVVETP